MAINTRQNSLLAAENWKKVYQTFQEADFTSYDFETLRKSMIGYLRTYYPEDFNDFTESSEFVALIDLIAFMGQSLAFRTDMNARENFIDTAERRDSILKLARLVSYNPKRNIAASGYLKIDSIIGSEALIDSNGVNLSGVLINWDDQTNDNWLEQFHTVLNAAMVNSQVVGKPGNTQSINGIRTEEYSINILPQLLSVSRFQASIEGSSMDFEAVSASSLGQSYLYEVPPKVNTLFNILYRNDNYGNSSSNTGFFVYFKQGSLATQDFTIAEAIPNRVYPFTNNNVNNNDVWLYSIGSNGNVQDLWKSVPAVSGVNIIYNKKSDRNLYQINSKSGDQIDLVFGDGSFANIPQGNYRLYYRSSIGLTYKITPDEMQNIIVPFSYVSRSGRVETLTVRASLKYTVTNANSRETSTDIKQKAPQQYYTQNRMITGEDYNIVPFTSFSNIVKVKSINRTSSGISRYLDTLDTTGKYSSTNVFANDGIIYADTFIRNFRFTFVSSTDLIRIINENVVADVLSANEIRHFYYANYPSYTITGHSWNLSTLGTNSATGYFVKSSRPAQVGGSVKDTASYIRKGAVLKFRAAPGYYFDPNNNMVPGTKSQVNDKEYLYASVAELLGDGTANGSGNYSNGVGPITLNIKIPTGAIIDRIYPLFKNNFTSTFTNSIVELVKKFMSFGLTYNKSKQNWTIIEEENLSSSNTFSLVNQGDTSATGLDASWLIKFTFDGSAYDVHHRGVEYIFQSAGETNFYYDGRLRVYDTKTATVLHDQITLLKTNSSPDSASPLGYDYTWYIDKAIIGTDGYASTDKIIVTFPDTNNDNIPDNPTLFEAVVAPATNPQNKYVFFKSVPGYDRFRDVISIDNKLVCSLYATNFVIENNLSLYSEGQIFYATETDMFYQLNSSRVLEELTDYIAKVGRQDLSFQYRHNSPDNRRIDPTASNIIDVYLLTASYESSYRNWIQDTSGTITMPVEPTSQELSVEYASLNDQRSLSDAIVFNSAKFKPLFGSKADTALQATFKVVKNPSIATSDNDIKTSVISAINTYFDISNWDFGEDFYFSELSAYLHRVLSPNIASIVIVPVDTNSSFGSLYQINAAANEIIISAATVENVEIITMVTASQLNLSLAQTNTSVII